MTGSRPTTPVNYDDECDSDADGESVNDNEIENALDALESADELMSEAESDGEDLFASDAE